MFFGHRKRYEHYDTERYILYDIIVEGGREADEKADGVQPDITVNRQRDGMHTNVTEAGRTGQGQYTRVDTEASCQLNLPPRRKRIILYNF